MYDLDLTGFFDLATLVLRAHFFRSERTQGYKIRYAFAFFVKK